MIPEPEPEGTGWKGATRVPWDIILTTEGSTSATVSGTESIFGMVSALAGDEAHTARTRRKRILSMLLEIFPVLLRTPIHASPTTTLLHIFRGGRNRKLGTARKRCRNLLQERTKHLLKFRSAKLHERLRFDLADAFACDTERSPDLFQSHCLPLTDSEAETDDRFFARAQGAQGLGHLLGHLTTVHLTICRRGLAIGDKIPQKGLDVTDRILKRVDFLERLHGLSHPITGGFHDAGHLFKGGGSSQPLS